MLASTFFTLDTEKNRGVCGWLRWLSICFGLGHDLRVPGELPQTSCSAGNLLIPLSPPLPFPLAYTLSQINK